MTSVEAVREVRAQLLRAGTVVARSDGQARDLSPVAIGEEEGKALLQWVRREGALRTLETGLGFAISTLFICEGLLGNGPQGRHVAADPFQFESLPSHRTTYGGVGLQVLEAAGVRDLVEFYPEESQIVLPRLLAETRRFDLAFIDGNHRFEGVFLDLVYCGRLLGEGKVVFVDDLQLPGVARAVSFCVANLGWAGEERGEEGPHEWIVLRTGPLEELLRPIDELTEF